VAVTLDSSRARDFIPLPRFRRAKSNFRMAESKIGMLSMRDHNKIALSLDAGGAIL
jgi:hypothetical protein